jgi:putative RNA 2'-phosphotransferase
MDKDLVRISKFLSLVLRHKPQAIGLSLDPHGWARVDELLAKANAHGAALTRDVLLRVVRENDKQRFALSEDGQLIRASQGHSLRIDLGLEPAVPPELLYHGTATRYVASIREQGLLAGKRDDVHLSPDEATALRVGQRHGKPVVLTVEAGLMHRAGYRFYLSANGVWLTEHVPAEYLVFPGERSR